jgi:hypothetical protein
MMKIPKYTPPELPYRTFVFCPDLTALKEELLNYRTGLIKKIQRAEKELVTRTAKFEELKDKLLIKEGQFFREPEISLFKWFLPMVEARYRHKPPKPKLIRHFKYIFMD